MQVILLQDVNKLGKKGDVVKINDGYARNFILPKKLGLEATEKNLKDLAIQKAEEEKRQQEIYAEAVALGKELESKKVTLQIKGGEGGKTFGSITAKEISQGLKDQTGIEIDKKKLVLADAIKTAGTFKVGVKLHPKVTVDLNVAVELV
ncbi:MAG: 50S ribosomal protein L9 [Lachnospiraceae bacterium]|jgi:large subunit ribosomal protein L9|nr:50S ribosomal protein L9 [Lachnospiraceae bacterium]MBQ6024000.1 50S ribosomal protein L9 [Lachnospiraceae bacterium]MBR3483893.1 50S ribosomal protein L9 [Lachnospiraceae bacterium]MBR3580427.1 50S ribosomal protein L9 [Lachnospiraceae bacterium]MBR4541772.1 50S ribosomal protein L9 [Lachnospiraceae bacterium]